MRQIRSFSFRSVMTLYLLVLHMVEVNCPIDGCDYSAPVGSVEGHISASQTGGHSGEVGRHFREELVDQAETTISSATDSSGLGESADGSGGDDRSDTVTEASTAPLTRGEEAEADALNIDVGESTDGSGGDDRSGEGGEASSDGSPIPPGKALVASALVLVGLAFGTTTDAETSAETADDQDGEQVTDSGGWPGEELGGPADG